MISKICSVIIAIVYSVFTMAQAPQKMSYQMVVRNSTNAIVTNQQVGVKISLLQGSATGTAVYEETHTPTTNANGLVSLVIGDGTVVSGNITNINWANGPYFIKTETDPAGGTNYSITGTSQLLSVPYALHAGSAPSRGKTYISLKGEITNAEADSIIQRDAGPETQFVWIQNTTLLTHINLSKVSNLLELICSDNADLVTIDFPELSGVMNKIEINRNLALQNLFLPLLKQPLNSLFITANPELEFIKAPMMESISTIHIGECLSLTAIDFNSLITTENVTVLNTAVTALSLPALKKAQIAAHNNPELVDILLPMLTIANGFNIKNNNVLATIFIPEFLHSYYDVTIESNNALQTFTAPKLSSVPNLTFKNDTSLLAISLPQLVKARSILVSGSSKITSFNLPLLDSCDKVEILSSDIATLTLAELSYCPTFISQSNKITSVFLPQLSKATNILLQGDYIASVSLPALKNCISSLSITGYNIGTISFPLLDSAEVFVIHGSTQITALTLPLLKYVGRLQVTDNFQLTNISIPQLNSIGNPFLPFGFSHLQFRNNKFSSVVVNALLNQFVNINPPFTNKKFDLRQMPPAPPTGQGLADKATLQSRPNTVVTD